MKVRKKSFLMTLLLVFVMMLSSISVFAADDGWEEVKYPPSEKPSVSAVMTDYANNGKKLEAKAGKSEEFGSNDNLVEDGDKGTIRFNKKAFENATDGSRKKAVGSFVSILQDSDVSPQTQQNIFEGMSNADKDLQAMMIPLIFDSTSADLYTAMKWVTPLLGVLRVVLGVGAIILVLLILASTLLDCIYIGIPMARGGKDGNSNDKPFGVSYDAISVVKEVESSLDGNSKYKNGYLIYLRRRAITYFVLGLCLLYLIVGELGGLMAWLMSLGSGIVG